MTSRKKSDKGARRPLITIKFAQTLDGRIATATGDSQWISSEASLRYAHQLRARHDAILVGIGTVLSDDPQLNVRLVKGKDPIRVIVDSRLRIPLKSKLLRDGFAERTIIACTSRPNASRAKNLQKLGAQVLRVEANGNSKGVDLPRLFVELNKRGIGSVLVEGGSQIITSLLNAQLADRLIVVVAPKLIGKGIDSIGDLGIRRLRDALKFKKLRTKRIGPDIVFDGFL